MAQAFDALPEQTRDQLACVYATLLLHDDGQEPTEENVKKVITAAGIKVQPYWPTLFVKAIQGRGIDSLLTAGGSGGAAPAPATGGATQPAGGAGGAKKEEEKPAVEEEAVSMGGLFD